MGKLSKNASFLLATSLLVLGPSPAFCDDLLVMPYACAIVGGRALLTPAQNQGHRIIGAHEQRSFRACSTADPTLCRQWTIHRFDLDCDGTPLPWATVVANARPNRAWLENGRLHVRMPPNWDLAGDDPCASGQRWRYGHLQRYCADRRALTPPAVEMPAGFAPLLGIDAIFVTPKNASQVAAYSSQLPAATPFAANVARSASEPEQSAAPKPSVHETPPAKEAAANPDLSPAAPMPAPIIPRSSSRPEQSAASKPSVHEPPPAKEAAANPGLSPAAPMPAPIIPRSSSRPEQSAASKPSVHEPPPAKEAAANPGLSPAAPIPAALSTPVVPRIINRPGAVAETAPFLPATAAAQTSSVREAPVLSIVPDAPEPGMTSLSSPRAAVAVVASVLVALTSIVLLLARGRRPRVGPNRDIARVSIGEPRREQTVVRAERAAPEPATIWSTAAGSRPTWSEDVPRTRLDALRVLGMGVTADVNLAAIKKIVDGLRQTWHPDLARDPSEREVREQRMKQINVAWDILAAKPAQT